MAGLWRAEPELQLLVTYNDSNRVSHIPTGMNARRDVG